MQRWRVDLFVKYERSVIVETDDVLKIEEMARRQVDAPEGARVSCQKIEIFAPVVVEEQAAQAAGGN